MIVPAAAGLLEFKQSAEGVAMENAEGVAMGGETLGHEDPKQSPEREVGVWLGIGIFLFPIIFSWFTLRKGHSTLSRVVALGYLGVIFLVEYIRAYADIMSRLATDY